MVSALFFLSSLPGKRLAPNPQSVGPGIRPIEE